MMSDENMDKVLEKLSGQSPIKGDWIYTAPLPRRAVISQKPRQLPREFPTGNNQLPEKNSVERLFK
jgi:hypothetical protein